MADSDSPRRSLRVRYKDLLPRFVVGALLIAIALFGGWRGGLFFNFMIGLAGLLMYREWTRMHRIHSRSRLSGYIAIAAAATLADSHLFLLAFGALAAAAGILFLTVRGAAVGLLYCGIPAVSLIWLRAEENGFALVIWALAIVWATDIFAYFAGRTIGGPKIAPSISPSKTWAGLAGGMIGAATIASLLTLRFELPFGPTISAMLGAVLAIAAQIGDFYESHLKRRAGVKDSGNLLPGHGGILDRLDGLVPVSIIVAAAVGLFGG